MPNTSEVVRVIKIVYKSQKNLMICSKSIELVLYDNAKRKNNCVLPAMKFVTYMDISKCKAYPTYYILYSP